MPPPVSTVFSEVVVLFIHTILVVAEEGKVFSEAGTEGRLCFDNFNKCGATDRLVVVQPVTIRKRVQVTFRTISCFDKHYLWLTGRY